MKKQLYKLFPFIPKVNFWIGLKMYAAKVKWNRNNVKKALTDTRDFYANIGCGSLGLDNWINIDWSAYQNVTYTFDCRVALPFADNSAKGLFTEHFFEHIDYVTDVPPFLQHCYRSLQKDGVLRIIVPDAEKYLFGYVQDGWDYLKQTRPLDDNLNDALMGIKYETKMQLVNEVFRQGGEHKYAWDFETMKLCLNKAGFTNVYKMAYLQSNDPHLKIDQAMRQYESLYVEAIK
ncbi:MAG: methyltransferase domain-containing protein [Bacteroidota bacterium]